MPKVSVIIATYNCADFVVQAIRSVLQQTFRDFEILVVDDGSTDDTAARLKQFDDKIRYFYQANAGPATAHNLALSHANGQYIAFLNSDDLWAPEKLELQTAYLDAHPWVGLVHTNFHVIDEDGNPFRLNVGEQKANLRGNCLLQLIRTSLLISTVMVRREWLFSIGLLDAWADPSDRDMYIRLLAAGCSFEYIPTPLMLYRIRRGSITQTSLWRILEGQVYTFQKYLARLKRSDVKASPQVTKLVERELDEVKFKLSRHYRIKGQRWDAISMLLPLILRRPWRLKYFARLATILTPDLLLEKIRKLHR